MTIRLVHSDLSKSIADEGEKRRLKKMLRADWNGVQRVAETVSKSPALLLPLTDLLSDPDPLVKRDAGWAIRELIGWKPFQTEASVVPPVVIESLGKNLGDRDMNVVNAALYALGDYAHALQSASVNYPVIKEILAPAMPYIKRYGFDQKRVEIC